MRPLHHPLTGKPMPVDDSDAGVPKGDVTTPDDATKFTAEEQLIIAAAAADPTGHARAGRAAVIFVCAFLLITLTSIASRTGLLQFDDLATVWIANGLAVAAMLRLRDTDWVTVLAALFAGVAIGNFLTGVAPVIALGYALGCSVEAAICAALVRPALGRHGSFDDSRTVSRFLLAAPFASICGTLIGAPFVVWSEGVGFLDAGWFWLVTTSLGMLIAAPLVLSLPIVGTGRIRHSLDQARRDNGLALRKTFLTAATFAAPPVVTFIVFSQDHAVFLGAIAPVFLLAAFSLPMLGAMAALVACSIIAALLTVGGQGPIVASAGGVVDPTQIGWMLQSFVASLLFLVLPVRGLMGERDALGARAKDSERKFLGIADASPAGIMHLDAAGLLTWFNSRLVDVAGRPSRTRRAAPWVRAVHPDDRGIAANLWRDVRRTGKAASIDVRRSDRFGGGWLEIGLNPIVEDGAIVGFVAMFTDISDRKQAMAQLRQSEQLYRLVTENARDIVLRIGMDGALIFVSSAACDMLGFASEDMVGRNLVDFVHPDDRDLLDSVIADLLASDGTPALRYRTLCADGDYRWAEAGFTLVTDDDGRPSGLVANVRDIHARYLAEREVYASEARLRENNRLLELGERLAKTAHWRYDSARRQFTGSTALSAMSGIAADDLKVRRLLKLLSRDERRLLLAQLAKALRARDAREISLRIDDLENGARHLKLIVQSERDENGDITGLVGVIADVTRQVKSHDELARARDQAADAARTKSQFLATMSHEIRTPMTGVLGMIDLLREERDQTVREAYLDALKTSGDLLMTVIDDILDFSKLESGKLRLDDRTFDLERVARDTVVSLDTNAAAKGLKLRFTGSDTPTRVVSGDPMRLRQVLLNLLANAIKFTPTGTIDVNVAATPLAGKQRWRIEVRDRGIGIDEEEQARLFQPFVQAQVSIHRQYGGTGLGLAICRRIVEAMGGKIGLHSQPGKGSTFWIELTLPDGVAEESEAGDTPVKPLGADLRLRPLRLLVAEDNPVNQMLISAMLTKDGHDVTLAGDGVEALHLAQADHYDAIVMDMQMPRMDGLATTRRIRGSSGPCADVPIIALTADASPERRRFYDGAGLSAFLTKPIDHDQLIATLSSLAGDQAPAAQEKDQLPMTDALIDEARLTTMATALGAGGLETMLGLLAVELRERPILLREHFEHNDADALSDAAHSLRGAAASAGAARIARIAGELEAATNDAQRSAILDAIDAAAAETLAYIDARIAGGAAVIEQAS